jgi:hypothetical protein
MTGGRPDGGRDIGAAVAQAMNDARTSYQLGYYAPLENWDGKFHKLRVTCKRNGVRVQAKTGYYAWPEDPDADGRQEVRAAVLQPFDAGEIGVRAALTSAAGAGTPKIKVVIDARDVAMTRDGDRYKGQLLVAMASYGSGGAVQASPMQTIDLDYAAADRDQVLSQGINYAPELPASQNLTSMRFIVFDQIAHTTGSVTIPLAASGSPDVSRKP